MTRTDPVAIIGVGCRFPGASGPAAFWRLLADGVDAIREVPPERWSLDELYDGDPAIPGKMTTRWGGFLADIDKFDAPFFGISPREAVHIDPQQRLLMEVAWEALEDAGLPPEKLAGQPVGVFVGMSSCDYGNQQLSDLDGISDGYGITGSALSIGANRLSYLFDFRGPSLVIDTACSSSLVAAYEACQSLNRGESRVALAGGVNLILSPAVTIGFSKLQAMAPDGRCKAFDARANGFVRGEGAGIVVLKPLADALSDGDRIYAVIRGGAINQDGRTNGLTAPNSLSQEALLNAAFTSAGISSSEINYVEAHGTGTALGDPIELNALGAVLAARRSRDQRCAVGSVKTNIGHLEAAAGIASLIKLALSIKERQLPPSLHFDTPNPYIRFNVLPLRVVTRLEPWPVDGEPIRAGVSAFGFGGTNVHLVLEEAPVRVTAAHDGEHQPWILPISARSEAALRSLTRAYAERLADAEDTMPLADLCATAAARRSHHDFRVAAIASSRAEMRSKLASFLDGQKPREVETGRRIGSRRRKIAFVFPGHGSQWIGMGRQLIQSEPVFAHAIDKCAAAISEHVDWSLTAELDATADSRLDEVDVIQPAMFAIQVALSELWRSWGIKPDVVVGHSMGEVAAAYVAGALSLPDAARIICERGRLAKRASGQGAMAMVELSRERATEILIGYEGRLGVAACNSPTSTVLSGDSEALETVLESLQGGGVFFRRVKIGYASHSPHMDPLKEDLLAGLQGVVAQKTSIPFCSTVCGAIVPGPELTPAYWVRNLREPVLFSSAIEKLLRDGIEVFLEVSPHPILVSAIQECMACLKRDGAALASLRRGEDERRSLFSTLASLYTIGKPVEWTRVYPGAQCVPLPGYPWQRERFWFEDRAGGSGKRRPSSRSTHPLIGDHIRMMAPPETHLWESELGSSTLPFLRDRSTGGSVGIPPALYLEMALEAAREAVPAGGSFGLDNIEFDEALVLAPGETRRMQVIATRHGPTRLDWQVCTGLKGPAVEGTPTFSRHAHGEIHFLPAEDQRAARDADSLDAIRARCNKEMAVRPSFQSIESVWVGDGEAIARLKPAPAVLHSAIEVLVGAMSMEAERSLLPASVKHVRLNGERAEGALWAHAEWTASGSGPVGNLRLLTESGALLAEANEIAVRSLEGSAGSKDEYFCTTVWTELPAGAATDGTKTPALKREQLLAASSDERVSMLANHLREQVANVLRIAAPRIDLNQSLAGMGIDSLMAVEMKGRVEHELGVSIPMVQLIKGPSLLELARTVAASMTGSTLSEIARPAPLETA